MKVRKLDWYGQLTVASLTVFSVPFFLHRRLLSCLFLLGCWQLVSAVSNTSCFMREGYRSKILFYWKLCLPNSVLIFLFVALKKYTGSSQLQIYFWITSIFAVIAIV